MNVGRVKRPTMLKKLLASLAVGIRSGVASLVSYYRDAFDPLRQDRLTRVYNRHEFERRRRTGPQVSLILIDLDDFKAINDRHGHDTGDQVLAAVASRIRQGFSSSEDGDAVFRIGGEEFAVLVHASLFEAVGIAHRLRRGVEELVLPGPIRVSLSAGVGRQRGNEDADELFRRVDAALYEAKSLGKNRVVASLAGPERPRVRQAQ